MEGYAQPALGHAASSKLDCGLHFLSERPGDYNRGLAGSVQSALRPQHRACEMLSMAKAGPELWWQGALLPSGENFVSTGMFHHITCMGTEPDFPI